MAKSSQQRAVENYRKRLAQRGLARFEVVGTIGDRELIRSVARHLAEGGLDADRLRAAVVAALAGKAPRRGGVLEALLASPLIGSGLEIARYRESGRPVVL